MNSHRFDEQVTGYDKQGNILRLLRYGRTSLSGYGLIGNLNLTYHGNQLQSVYDNATNSAYGNGMDFKDGASQSQEYVYDAEGTKLRTTHIIGNDTMLTDYCGNLIYENGVAAWLLTESGYITLADDKYHYYLKDHQGNNRVVVDETGNVEEVNDYYPFGGLMSSSSSNSVQPYKYNGKELDRKGGLDWYDYGARHYDAVIGRWHAVDPSSEKYYGCSPYTYCKNSPVLRIDLDGKDDYVVTKSGRLFNETPKNMRI